MSVILGRADRPSVRRGVRLRTGPDGGLAKWGAAMDRYCPPRTTDARIVTPEEYIRPRGLNYLTLAECDA